MSFRLRRTLLTGVITLAVLGATAFGVSGGTTHASAVFNHHQASHSHKLTNVYFILNWLPNVEFDGLWAAQKFGWWKKAGLNLTFKGWTPTVNPETDVPNKGGNTFGFQSAAAIAIARARGVPIQSLYADAEHSVFGLTVMDKSHIKSLKQLKGKKVGYQSHELYAVETMLSCVGLHPGDYRSVPVGFDISALTSGSVDAYLTFLTNEPIALKLAGVKAHSFAASNYCFHFYDDVMFTTTNLIHSNPKLVRTVTRIVARGFKWAHNNPDAAARYTVANYFSAHEAGSSAAKNLEQQKLESEAFGNFSRDPHGHFSGLMTRSYWQDSVNILFKYHIITSKPNVMSLYTNRFNPNNPNR